MGNPKFRTVKRCIFCPNDADSREHAWSEWALNRLAFTGGIYGTFDDIVYHDPKQKHLRVKCVCENCNEVWMKNLEDTIIPTIGDMMVDKPMSLDIPQQWAIARWALESAMVFEHINRTTEIFYTDSEREDLRLAGSLPPLTFAWIGRVLGAHVFFAFGNEIWVSANSQRFVPRSRHSQPRTLTSAPRPHQKGKDQHGADPKPQP